MDKTTQIVFVILTAAILISVIIQSAAILSMLVAARKLHKKTQALMDEFRLRALPAIASSSALLEELSPKLKILTANLVDASSQLKSISEDVGGVVSDVTQRTRAQAAHVDGMIEGTLDQISQATHSIQHGISVPVKQLTGVVNGVRAALKVMLDKPPKTSVESEDEDLFV
jgi:hypothetical protein